MTKCSPPVPTISNLLELERKEEAIGKEKTMTIFPLFYPFLTFHFGIKLSLPSGLHQPNQGKIIQIQTTKT